MNSSFDSWNLPSASARALRHVQGRAGWRSVVPRQYHVILRAPLARFSLPPVPAYPLKRHFADKSPLRSSPMHNQSMILPNLLIKHAKHTFTPLALSIGYIGHWDRDSDCAMNSGGIGVTNKGVHRSARWRGWCSQVA
jgi:hypothetical protein